VVGAVDGSEEGWNEGAVDGMRVGDVVGRAVVLKIYAAPTQKDHNTII
jgi:hypothetical protein